MYMSKAKSSKKPKSTNHTTNIASLRLILGGYLVVLLLAQLFAFEKFPSMLESIGLGDWSTVVAIVLALAQLLALPFLIGLKLPTRLVFASFVSVFVALVLLSVLEVMALISDATILFGATLDLPGAFSSICLLSVFTSLVTFSIIISLCFFSRISYVGVLNCSIS